MEHESYEVCRFLCFLPVSLAPDISSSRHVGGFARLVRVFEDERLVRFLVAERSTACAFSVPEGKESTLENVAEEAVSYYLLSWFAGS